MEKRLSIPETPELVFSEEGHKYLLDGVEIPSVTQVMEPLSQHEYTRVDEQTLMRAADRGTMVHNAIENYIKFGIDDCPEEHRGYMDAFLEWWGLTGPEAVGSELRTYHKLYRYAGTIDLVAMIDGKLTLIDYKTTYKLMDKNVRVQLEAYAQALRSHGIIIERKMVLHLHKDGKWSAPEYLPMDAEALRVFNSCKCLCDYLAK